MVRYINATVTIYEPTTSINDEGEVITEYKQGGTIKGDVQPARLSESEIKLYGLSERSASCKKFFYSGYCPAIKEGNRASVESSLEGGSVKVYEIQPMNAWPRHGECLLVPVENE